MCRLAQAGAGSAWPRPIGPFFQRAILAVELCWHRWSLDVALGKACLLAWVSSPQQREGLLGCLGAGGAALWAGADVGCFLSLLG